MAVDKIKTPNGAVYHVQPGAKGKGAIGKEQWTTNADPTRETPPRSTPSMARVLRLLPEIDSAKGRQSTYTVIIWGKLKRSGGMVYPEDMEPTVTKSGVIPRGELNDLTIRETNTAHFANEVVRPYGYEWKEVYSIAMRPA